MENFNVKSANNNMMNENFDDMGNDMELVNDYNWDDLSIGNHNASHQSYFFGTILNILYFLIRIKMF